MCGTAAVVLDVGTTDISISVVGLTGRLSNAVLLLKRNVLCHTCKRADARDSRTHASASAVPQLALPTGLTGGVGLPYI